MFLFLAFLLNWERVDGIISLGLLALLVSLLGPTWPMLETTLKPALDTAQQRLYSMAIW